MSRDDTINMEHYEILLLAHKICNVCQKLSKQCPGGLCSNVVRKAKEIYYSQFAKDENVRANGMREMQKIEKMADLVSSLKCKIPAGAKPNWKMMTINPFDKSERGRGFGFKEAAEYRDICSIHIDQLIRCYCLIDRAMTRDELIARCSDCPYAVAKPKTANVMDTNKYPYFIEQIADIEWDDPKYYVYLISDGEYIKIGIAKDVKTRLCELQVGNSKQLELICAIPLKSEKNARRLEEKLHLEYDEFSIRGEWYNILSYINVQAFSKYFQKRRTDDEQREAD